MLLELHSKKRKGFFIQLWVQKYSYIDCPKRMRAELLTTNSRSVGLAALEPTPDVVTRNKMQGL